MKKIYFELHLFCTSKHNDPKCNWTFMALDFNTFISMDGRKYIGCLTLIHILFDTKLLRSILGN